jgi:hypothetical protein
MVVGAFRGVAGTDRPVLHIKSRGFEDCAPVCE